MRNINIIVNDNLRKYLVCFRMSSHNLEIETDRYNIVRENRLCKLCSKNVIENEYYCINRNLRIKYDCNVSWSNKNTFYRFMIYSNMHIMYM